MNSSSSSQRSLRLCLLLLLVLCHEVAANTEIINFASPRTQTAVLPWDVGNWPSLSPSKNEQQWTLEPAALHTPLHHVCERHEKSACPHELWLLLDLDDEEWASYSAFTLRLSWPASSPAEFTIAIHDPRDLLDRLPDRDLISTGARTSSGHTPTTRSRYARIRAVHAGVPTPSSRSHASMLLSARSMPLMPQPRAPSLIPVRHPDDTRDHDQDRAADGAVGDQRERGNVSFVVILEPLYWGVLPATLLPTVAFLVPVVLGAALLVPYVNTYLEPYARQAKVDVKTRMAQASKEQ